MFISVRNSHATLHHWGKTDREKEIGTDAAAVEEHHLLAWQLPKDSLADILTPLSPAAPRGTTHNRLGLSLPTINLNYAPKGDLVVTFSQLKFSPPPIISLCQVAIKCVSYSQCCFIRCVLLLLIHFYLIVQAGSLLVKNGIKICPLVCELLAFRGKENRYFHLSHFSTGKVRVFT